jgi:hypothetical protein
VAQRDERDTITSVIGPARDGAYRPTMVFVLLLRLETTSESEMNRDERDNDLVPIGTVANPTEGGMIREFLGSHDILCTVQGEHHRSSVPLLGIVDLSLLVPRKQAAAAHELLQLFRSGAVETADDEDDAELAPDDGGDNLEIRRRKRGARMLGLFLPGLGLGHFGVGAPLRGLVLLTAWPVAILLARSMGGAAFALPLFSMMLDVLALPSPKPARAALPRARAVRHKP